MEFIVDMQTLEDLNITGKYKSNSVFSIYNKTKTVGGERLLQHMFQNPMLNPSDIESRTQLFSYFQSLDQIFPMTDEQVISLEEYSAVQVGGKIVRAVHWMSKKFQSFLLYNPEFKEKCKRQDRVIKSLLNLKVWLGVVGNQEQREFARGWAVLNRAVADFDTDELEYLVNNELTFLERLSLEHKLAKRISGKIPELLKYLYELDVYLTVSRIAKERGLCYGTPLPGKQNSFYAQDLWHLAIRKGVPNTIRFDDENNLLFLTGANMAGKSTLMKAVGIAFYLAHMGFPVPAKEFGFSIMDGLYTSINLPDSLEQGQSHYYAEVVRVKRAAELVGSGKKMLFIFDELFKGTNVKDAYEATLAVTEGFAQNKNCFFVISTHIVEVCEALNRSEHITFGYMPSRLEQHQTRYSYKLTKGVSRERHGMTIIRNENIMELIKGESSI
nr:hypothetical protein [uncultured Allomuricauda sp.]